jgi:hypothetical protein
MSITRQDGPGKYIETADAAGMTMSLGILFCRIDAGPLLGDLAFGAPCDSGSPVSANPGVFVRRCSAAAHPQNAKDRGQAHSSARR